jgi:hypothetical protein
MKKNFLWMLLGALITVTVILGYNFFTGYRTNIGRMSIIQISYKGEQVYTGLSADVRDYITEAKKTRLYIGELPEQEAIKIDAPRRATLYVYPLDENSLLIRYEPRNGIRRTYIKSGYGDFNRVLKSFYELTDNEVFNEVVKY